MIEHYNDLDIDCRISIEDQHGTLVYYRGKITEMYMNKDRHPYMYKIEYNGTSRKIIPRILDGVLTTNFRRNILRVYVDA